MHTKEVVLPNYKVKDWNRIQGDPKDLYEAIYQRIWNDVSVYLCCYLEMGKKEIVVSPREFQLYLDSSLGCYNKILKTIDIEQVKKFYTK